MATIRVCDRCGSKCEVKNLNTLVVWPAAPPMAQVQVGHVDLCGECFLAFREWVDHGD